MGPNSFLVCTVSVALFVEQSGLGSLERGGRSLSVAFGGVLRVVVAGECWAVEGIPLWGDYIFPMFPKVAYSEFSPYDSN